MVPGGYGASPVASDSQAENEREGPPNAAAVVSDIVGLQVDETSFGECYENLNSAKKVLQDLSYTLQRVQHFEPDELESTKFHLRQFLQFSLARPSLQNGQALQKYIASIRASVDFRANWPTEPLPDARGRTCLDGEDQIIFQHPSEGLIRLQWMNPLPKPAWLQHGGYQCDACFNPDIRQGYQHVTEDNARDNSRLLEERTGYDVCARCAERHIWENRTKIETWFYDIAGTAADSYRRFPEDLAEVGLVVRRRQSAALVEVTGSGGFHCALAVMQKHDKLPETWMAMARKLTTSPRKATSPFALDMQFQCAKSGDVIALTRDPTAPRGRLGYVRASASKTCGEVHALHAAACDGADGEEGLWQLRFPPLGECAWLKSQRLEEVRVLASRAGCAHNISRKPSDEIELTHPASTSSDAARADLSFATHGPGTRGGFFEPFSSDVCAICLGSLGEQTWIRGEPWQTRCGHYFHRMCLRRHLRSSSGTQSLDTGACPNCRLPGAALGTTNCSAKPLSWLVTEDIRSEPLEMEKEYRFLAVLCQDPEAVVHSSIFLVQMTLKFKDLPVE